MHNGKRLCKLAIGAESWLARATVTARGQYILVKTANAMSKEKICRDIQRHAVKQVTHVDSLARCRQFVNEVFCPPLEDVHVADLVLDKHGPDQGTAALPLLAIGSEDAVAQKRSPGLMKLRALAKLGELAGENSLDVLWLLGNEKATTKEDEFDGVWAFGRRLAEEPHEVVDETVRILHTYSAYGNLHG